MPKGSILKWETKVAALRHFHRENGGSSLVPQSYIDPITGFKLGRWVANLRQRSDFLSEKQLRDLDSVGFVWTHRSKVMPWADKIDILKRYKERNGDTLVPKDYVDPLTGFRLGGMVDRLRQSRSTLNKSRVAELEELGFVWNKYEAHWENMFQLLVEYKQEHNHLCPTTREMYQGKPLGQWVAVQKQLYSRKQRQVSYNATISAERVKRLESIGFSWTWKRGSNGSNKNSQDEDGSNEDEDASLSSVDSILLGGGQQDKKDNKQEAKKIPAATLQSIPPAAATVSSAPQAAGSAQGEGRGFFSAACQVRPDPSGTTTAAASTSSAGATTSAAALPTKAAPVHVVSALSLHRTDSSCSSAEKKRKATDHPANEQSNPGYPPQKRAATMSSS